MCECVSAIMLKIILVILLLILFIITKCKCVCKTETEEKVICGSVKDVSDSGYQPTWKEIHILHNSSEDRFLMQRLSTNMFRSKPNVIMIEFWNAVDQIDIDAFNGLESLQILHFYNCNFPELKSNWVSGLPIDELVISNSKVATLKHKCFDYMTSLRNLKIEKNIILKISVGIFNHTDIQRLDLNNNRIQFIEKEAFFGMKLLGQLRLYGNHLTSFEPKLYIGNTSPELSDLELFDNEIKIITANNFELFPKLRILHLFNNGLEEIEEGAFHNIPLLSYLDLSNNKIDYIPETAFPDEELEYMDMLFLHNNRLTFLSINIILYFPFLAKITIGGNPWQCSCYKDLNHVLAMSNVTIVCDDEYLDGLRPICVVPDENPRRCDESPLNQKHLYQKYSKTLALYSKLLPVCKMENNSYHYANNFLRFSYTYL